MDQKITQDFNREEQPWRQKSGARDGGEDGCPAGCPKVLIRKELVFEDTLGVGKVGVDLSQQCLSAVKMTGARCCLGPSQILIPLIPNRSLSTICP